MDLALILVGLLLLTFAPLALRLDPPPQPPPNPGPAPRRPVVRFHDSPLYAEVMQDPEGRRQLEALIDAGGPSEGDLITLSTGRCLRVL